MRKLAIYLAMVAAVGISSCGDKDPVSSNDDTTSPTAKLTVSGGKAGGAPYRPASTGKVEGTSSPSGLAVSSAAVGGKPDRVARITLETPVIDKENLTVTIDGSVTAAQPGTEITRLPFNWGDGTTEDLSFPVEHTYDGSAAYTVTITAFNDRSEFQSTSLNVVLAIEFPDAGLEAAVRDAIGKSSGDIFSADVADLNYLFAADREIVDLDGIDRLPALDSLDVARNQVSDLSLVAGIPLIYLRLYENPIDDYSPIAGMTSLIRLDMWDENLADISFVSGLTNLEIIVAVRGKLTDLSPVANLTNLTILWVHTNEITDISPVADLTNLEILNLATNMISDISPVADLTALTFLSLGFNQITDISVVANLTALTFLDLVTNQISDISAVANLTALTTLNLNENQISDVTALENLTELGSVSLHLNQVTDLTALVDNTGIGTDDYIGVNDNPLSDDAKTTQIPALEARGATVDQ